MPWLQGPRQTPRRRRDRRQPLQPICQAPPTRQLLSCQALLPRRPLSRPLPLRAQPPQRRPPPKRLPPLHRCRQIVVLRRTCWLSVTVSALGGLQHMCPHIGERQDPMRIEFRYYNAHASN